MFRAVILAAVSIVSPRSIFVTLDLVAGAFFGAGFGVPRVMAGLLVKASPIVDFFPAGTFFGTGLVDLVKASASRWSRAVVIRSWGNAQAVLAYAIREFF